MRERLGEKGVQRLDGLMAEPRENAPPPPAGEQIRIQRVGRHPIDARQQAPQLRDGLAAGRRRARVLRPRRQTAPQRRLPAMGDGEESRVVETEKRAFQRLGERKIVARKQQEPPERHQVHDGHMPDEKETVGAGDGDARIPELAHEFMEKAVALAHEDENIAGARHAVAAREPMGAVAKLADGARDGGGGAFGGVPPGRGGARQRPGILHGGRLRHDERPHFHAARLTRPLRMVAHGAPAEHHARLRASPGEHRVHRRQHGFRRAEGDVERHILPLPGGAANLRRKPVARGVEHGGVGALKAIDRLFGIADRENGAQGVVARAFAGKEFHRQRARHVPLFGAGVLRFVDENMVESAVELEEHPFGAPRPRHEIARGKDQIVVIDPAARALARLIVLQHRMSEGQDRGGRAGGGGPVPADDRPFEALRLRPQDLRGARRRLEHRRGRESFPDLPIGREIEPAIVREPVMARLRARGQASAQAPRRAPRRSCPARPRGRAPHGAARRRRTPRPGRRREWRLRASPRARRRAWHAAGAMRASNPPACRVIRCRLPRRLASARSSRASVVSCIVSTTAASASASAGAPDVSPSPSPSASPSLSPSLSTRANSAFLAAAITSPDVRSSMTSKWGATPASSGKRRSNDWQKACRVWMRAPPGASRTRVSNCRARRRIASPGAAPSSAVSATSRASSAATAHSVRRSCRRLAISAAAARVKV